MLRVLCEAVSAYSVEFDKVLPDRRRTYDTEEGFLWPHPYKVP